MELRSSPRRWQTAVRKRGRPRRVEGERASERIWALLTPNERASLVAAAKENGITISQLIRDAVNDYVADYGERPVFAE